MANKRVYVTADGFADAVGDLLDDYFKEVSNGSTKAVGNIAIETVQELEATSPKDRGDYAKGWYIKPYGKNRYHAEVEIGNKIYQLTHLLEHGHIQKVHGKVVGFTKGKPHIAKAEQNAVNKLLDEIREVAKGK